MLFYTATALGAILTMWFHPDKESYTDPSQYVPWILIGVALVVTTMAVRAMSPIIHLIIAAALLWYIWKVPTVKTMTQNALQEISMMMPVKTDAPAAVLQAPPQVPSPQVPAPPPPPPA